MCQAMTLILHLRCYLLGTSQPIVWFVSFQVFDAYAQFEESMISAKMETTAEMGPSEEGTAVKP